MTALLNFLRDFIALLPNWLTSLISGLVVGALVYLSTNLTWGWHDGIAFAAGYALSYIGTDAERNKSNNILGINWKKSSEEVEAQQK